MEQKMIEKKTVECIARINIEGNIEPVRFRFEDEAGMNHVIQITNILGRDVKYGITTMNGIPAKLYTFQCESIIEGLTVPFQLQYDSKSFIWYLVK